MKERPINFKAPMVRALLNGSKTQHRVIVKPQPFCLKKGVPYTMAGLPTSPIKCPYGEVGDRLWVRESGWIAQSKTAFIPSECNTPPPGGHVSPNGATYKRCPSIQMPRWASRIELEITGVRVERLYNISEADCIAEGIEKTSHDFWRIYGKSDVSGTCSPKNSYRSLWESIYSRASWDANPWVWVIEFKKLEQTHER